MGDFEVWLLNGCGPNLYFPKAFGKVPDFNGKNPMTCQLTFAVEIRHCFAFGDMDCDNHTKRGKCWYNILSTLNLCAGPCNIQKYYFFLMGPREHPEWRSVTRSDTEALRVHFLDKMTKMPLVNLGLTESQTRSKSSQNNTFHGFSPNRAFRRFLAILTKFDKVWLEVDPRWAQKP